MNIRTKITKLSENDLRKKVIIPLLNGLGAYGTEDFHGPKEKGKDVYFSYKNLCLPINLIMGKIILHMTGCKGPIVTTKNHY